MNWSGIGSWVAAFTSQHKEALGLFALAMAVTMRPKLPWPFVLVEPLEWLYEWVRDGLLTFVSMRGPAHAESTAHEKTVTNQDGKVVEASVKIESSTSIPGAPATVGAPRESPPDAGRDQP